MIRIHLEADKSEDEQVKQSLLNQIQSEVAGKDPRIFEVSLDSEIDFYKEGTIDAQEAQISKTIDRL